MSWFRKKPDIDEDYLQLTEKDKLVHKIVTKYALSIGMKDKMHLSSAMWTLIIEMKNLRDKIEVLEKTFNDTQLMHYNSKKYMDDNVTFVKEILEKQVEKEKELICMTCRRIIPYSMKECEDAKEILFYEVCIHGHGQQDKRIIQHPLCKECVDHFSDNWKELKEIK